MNTCSFTCQQVSIQDSVCLFTDISQSVKHSRSQVQLDPKPRRQDPSSRCHCSQPRVFIRHVVQDVVSFCLFYLDVCYILMFAVAVNHMPYSAHLKRLYLRDSKTRKSVTATKCPLFYIAAKLPSGGSAWCFIFFNTRRFSLIRARTHTHARASMCLELRAIIVVARSATHTHTHARACT